MNQHSFIVTYTILPFKPFRLLAQYLNFPEKGVRVFKTRERVRMNPSWPPIFWKKVFLSLYWSTPFPLLVYLATSPQSVGFCMATGSLVHEVSDLLTKCV
jgi:hypothetical protein